VPGRDQAGERRIRLQRVQSVSPADARRACAGFSAARAGALSKSGKFAIT
jgi:hypothetical protein